MYKVSYGNPVADSEIVSLDLAKMNSNIQYTSDDDLFALFLDAIELEIEDFVSNPVLEREEVKVMLKHWESPYDLPVNFNAIASITYKNDAGADITIEPEDYDVFESELTLNIEEPTDYKGPITITGSAGYATAKMPAHFKNAALLMFTERETFRENRAVKMNTAAKEILRPYKKY